MTELAEAFFPRYRNRLTNGKPHLSNPDRKTVQEHIVEAYRADDLTEAATIDRVEQQGFSDVVPRFQVVTGVPVPVTFYEKTSSDLILIDHLLDVFRGNSGLSTRASCRSRHIAQRASR